MCRKPLSVWCRGHCSNQQPEQLNRRGGRVASAEGSEGRPAGTKAAAKVRSECECKVDNYRGVGVKEEDMQNLVTENEKKKEKRIGGGSSALLFFNHMLLLL